MNKLFLILLSLSCIILSHGQSPDDTIDIYNINIELLDSLLYEKVNIVRRQHGKDPLKTLPQLHKVSQHHSKYMAITGDYSHDETVENDSIEVLFTHKDRFNKYKDTINGVSFGDCLMGFPLSIDTNYLIGPPIIFRPKKTYNEISDFIINAWVTSKKGHRYFFLMDYDETGNPNRINVITHFSISAYPSKIKHYRRTGTTSNGLDWVDKGVELEIYFSFTTYRLR